MFNIKKTCPCNKKKLIPHLYIAKLGGAGVYFFLIIVQKHRLWIPPRLGGSNVFSQSSFEHKY